MRPSTCPSASMMCQRALAAAESALAMNVDIPETTLSKTREPMLGDFPPGQATSRAGPGNRKPQSYECFWALSRVARQPLMGEEAPADKADRKGNSLDSFQFCDRVTES